MRFIDKINGVSQPTYLFKVRDSLYQISGDIRLFKVNGKLIPQEQWKPYQQIMRSLMEPYRRQENEITEYLEAHNPTKPVAEPLEQTEVHSTSTTTETTQRSEDDPDPIIDPILSELRHLPVNLGFENNIRSFKLSEQQLVINNVVQSGDLHRQLKDHHVKPGSTIYYNYDLETDRGAPFIPRHQSFNLKTVVQSQSTMVCRPN